MDIKNLFHNINLQLFAEGGEGAGDGGTDVGGANGVSAGVPILQTKGVKNPLANVKYGVQEEDVQTANAQDTDGETKNDKPVDLDAEFEELIKGKFKDQYDKRTKETIQKRLKNSKETVDKYNKLAPTLDMLSKKYGVDASDLDALNKAIEDDDSYYEEEALEKGVSVEELKAIKKMEKENAELKKEKQERKAQEEMEKDIADWMRQAESAKNVFPNLDLGEELKNPQFFALMKQGVGLETAYFALHHRELVPQAMAFATKTAEQKVTNKVIANGARPTENGLNSQSPSVVKSDVRTLSKADRQEIARRVARGEEIRF